VKFHKSVTQRKQKEMRIEGEIVRGVVFLCLLLLALSCLASVFTESPTTNGVRRLKDNQDDGILDTPGIHVRRQSTNSTSNLTDPYYGTPVGAPVGIPPCVRRMTLETSTRRLNVNSSQLGPDIGNGYDHGLNMTFVPPTYACDDDSIYGIVGASSPSGCNETWPPGNSLNADSFNKTQYTPTLMPECPTPSPAHVELASGAPLIIITEQVTSAPSVQPSILEEPNPKREGDLQVTIYGSVNMAIPHSARTHLNRHQIDEHYLSVLSDTMDLILNESSLFFVQTQPYRRLEQVLIPNKVKSNISQLALTMYETWMTAHIAYNTTTDSSDAHAMTLTTTVHTAVTSGMFLEQAQMLAPEILQVTVLGVSGVNGLASMETQSWSTRQWVGVGIFSFTLVVVLLLMSTALRRRRKRDEQDNWGVKLGTEHDVSEMLNVGWDGQKIFEKAKIGYRDDDSIFLGGFEHTQTAPISTATTTS